VSDGRRERERESEREEVSDGRRERERESEREEGDFVTKPKRVVYWTEPFTYLHLIATTSTTYMEVGR
jgi:hypothetical protein